MPGRLAQNLIAAFLLGALAVAPAAAAPNDVFVVLSKESGAYEQVATSIQSVLAGKSGARPSLHIVALAGFNPREIAAAKPGLIVTVGVEAARRVAEENMSAPVLHTLIPRLTHAEIMKTGAKRRESAIYLDQPFSRQLDLARVALPQHRRLAVILGPSSESLQPELRAAAREKRLQLSVEKMTQKEELPMVLNRLLEENDVLISVADPLVFNSGTIHHLLLTTYRYKIPVVGLSKAYVDAGALIAVYSSPEQIGRQIAETLLQRTASGTGPLPPPQYPKYFTIAINHRVAASLGIHIEEEAVILRKLLGVSGP
jgi:ABC-type uncharacterized transport system substrate-binding protein